MSLTPTQLKRVAAAVIVAALVAGVAAIASVYAPEMSGTIRNLERRVAWPP